MGLYGKAAGPIRNRQMINRLNPNTDEVLAYHEDLDKSKGTKHAVEVARQSKIKVIIKNC